MHAIRVLGFVVSNIFLLLTQNSENATQTISIHVDNLY